jgi:hypothetical protein
VQATYDNMTHMHVSTNTHSDYVMQIFPLQQRFHEDDSVLLYTYIACLVYLYIQRAVSGNHSELDTCSCDFFSSIADTITFQILTCSPESPCMIKTVLKEGIIVMWKYVNYVEIKLY